MATTAVKDSGIHVVVFDERDKIVPLIRNALVEPVSSFNHLGSCMSHIDEITKNNEVTVVVTPSLEERVLKTFEGSDPVEAVFILSTTGKTVNKSFSKVVGVYARVNDLLRALFAKLESIETQLNGNSMLFHCEEDGSYNYRFFFYQLWLTHKMSQNLTKENLVEQASIFFRPTKPMKQAINEFDTLYNRSSALSWIDQYTHPFPYHILASNALRAHDQHVLGLARFFILDITRQLKLLSSTNICTQAYYGTRLPMSVVNRLEHQASTDIVAFQCFLPATKTRATALAAASQPTHRRKMVSVLFKIEANNAYGVHMGNITLIDMATPFHVTNVARYTGFSGDEQIGIVVQLVALNRVEKGQLYEQFTEQQKREGRTIDDFLLEAVPLLRADDVHQNKKKSQGQNPQDVSAEEAAADEYMSRGEWGPAIQALSRIDDPDVRVLNKAGCILRENLQDLPNALECHERALRQATGRERADTLMYIGIVYNDMRQHEEALKCYSQALQWYENEKPRDPATIARCLVGLGNSHWACKQLDEALECAQRALVLREQEVKPVNDFDIVGCLGNMGNILHDRGDMEGALACAKRAADILSRCGSGDPRLAAALNNLGAMYQVCEDYVKAREYFQRALEVLPIENHPYRISTLNNLSRLNAIENGQKS